ncbi:MAG: FlgD immunoglobulin-like domain containing protein, partial [Thermonemataceae bacterium]|nr:FlgD immunoglobulin-like domain containing protein [Thermonemataceae bacterium]
EYTFMSFDFIKGNVANVEIYDAQGRLIKYLARNQTLANEGSLIWDGSNENGSRVRRGYYLIRFEIFDLSGKKEIFKESVAVTFDF